MVIKIEIDKSGSIKDVYTWFWVLEVDGEEIERNWARSEDEILNDIKESIKLEILQKRNRA